ncbi:hypothetical protein OROHE_019423 [Orobanche hederae]
MACDGNLSGEKIGQKFVLPSSYIGSPWDMQRRYLNALALVSEYGKPYFFITVTCNPNWPEIREGLLPGEEAQNRSDLVARVFRARNEEFKNEIVTKKLLAQMEPKIYALNDITPDMKNWTTRVCVLNKTGPRISSQATPIKFQKLLLADEQGNKVEAMLYRSDVDLLNNSLQSDETYLISNALVQPVKQGFENPLVNNKYQWIIGARTAVLPTEKKDFVFSALTPVFTHYNQFHKFIGTKGLISTVAVIFSKHDQRCVSSRGRENTLREYVAVDEAFTPFVITFWNDAVPEDTYSMLDCIHNQHVIAALNFTVTKFHGVAIFEINISHSARHLPHSSCFTLKISVLRNFKNGLNPGRFTSTVKGQLLRTNQKFVYLCCGRCHCLTSAEYGCLFECRSCRLNKIATPRYIFSLSVFDATGELEVTMFGKEAEKLLNLSTDDFWQKYQEDTSFVHTFINSKLEEMLLQIEIQSKTFLKQDGNIILSYTVQSLNCQKTTPLPACPDAFTEQPSSCGITYLVPAENANRNENLTVTPPIYSGILQRRKSFT